MQAYENPSPRRVGLTVLFAVWLSIQGAVLGLTPAWGFILPHDHITRGPMSEADWAQHMEQHRLGIRYTYVFTPNCTVPSSQNSRVVESVPDFNGTSSVFSFFTVNLDAFNLTLRPPHTRPSATPTVEFYAFDFFLTPLELPPNI